MSGRPPKIALFGHFGRGNFGNEATLLAMLQNLRIVVPHAKFTCICTDAWMVARDYNIKAIRSRDFVVKPWEVRSLLVKFLRKLLVGIPSELYRWLAGFKTLWRTDALIIPGTGLLTDAYTLFDWGPYDLFRWSVIAKLCRCKLMFVSVGAGPIYSRIGGLFVKAALSIADFRSYRDESTLGYLKSVGFCTDHDPIYPDLAFSLLTNATSPAPATNPHRRLVVGLGLMEYAGRYSVENPDCAVHHAYLAHLVEFTKWLLAHEYDVRLLIGDLVDRRVIQEFRSLLKERSVTHDEGRIVDQPVDSVASLLVQLAATDYVVATRFHNVLLSMLLNKPVIAISFHHKCSSLMSQMGMSEYCQDINALNADNLIERFRQLRRNADCIMPMLRNKVESCQSALDEQYGIILGHLSCDRQQVTSPSPSAPHSQSSKILS